MKKYATISEAKKCPEAREALLAWFAGEAGRTWEEAGGPELFRVLDESDDVLDAARSEIDESRTRLRKLRTQLEELDEWVAGGGATGQAAGQLRWLNQTVAPWLEAMRTADSHGWRPAKLMTLHQRIVHHLDATGRVTGHCWPFGRPLEDIEVAKLLMLMGQWPGWAGPTEAKPYSKSVDEPAYDLAVSVKATRKMLSEVR